MKFKEEDKINPVGETFKRGFYMFLWQINPTMKPSHQWDDEKGKHIETPPENSMGAQFYNSIEEIEKHTNLFKGSWVILQLTAQNPNGQAMFWSKVRSKGESFDIIKALTTLPEEYRLEFEKPPKEDPKGTMG